MARRQGKKGDYLITDDYTGFTTYRSKVKEDYWGNITEKPMKRNLQEIASPLLDPYPVSVFRGPQYEVISNHCVFEVQPLVIGRTTRPFPTNSAASQALDLKPSLGEMEVGCTFRVY